MARQTIQEQHARVKQGHTSGLRIPVEVGKQTQFEERRKHAGLSFLLQGITGDVRVRPALDDDGREQLNENKLSSPDAPAIVERAQQPAQQQ